MFLVISIHFISQHFPSGLQNRYVEEIFDREDRLRRTRELYFEAFARLRDVENVAVVDGSGSREQVARRVWAAVAPYFA